MTDETEPDPGVIVDPSEPREVSIRMGDLEVKAQGETLEEAEKTAERIFENRLDDAAEMTEAVKTVTRGYR